MKNIKNARLSVWQFLALGYLIVIFAGSLFLTLPVATRGGEQPTSYINALFTSVSATCVTGLTPYNTGAHWSLFGQIVILILIQTGGLGFMTFVSSVFMLFKHMGLYERKAMLASAGGQRAEGLGKLVRRIFLGTAIFEFTGAALLSIRFIGEYGTALGIYYAVWHSVSAFCNAGFDILGGASLVKYATDPLVSLTICALIIIGGLGFCVWGDIVDTKFNVKKFQLNTKMVLFVSSIMLVGSTALFMVFEWNNYDGYNFWQKLLCCFFNATSPRTAGFFSTDPEALSESSYMLTLALMFVGGNSGSTAGGIKVGTFTVIIMGMISVFRGGQDINIGKKRLKPTLVAQALAIFAAFLMIAIISTIAICAIEPDTVSAKYVVFECFSALGTVGLSLNLTPQLSIASKIIIMLLMYTGRVGILTLALALGEKHSTAAVRKPVDSVLIG